MILEILTTVIALFAFITIMAGIKVVGQSDIYVVERLGKFNRELRAGFHLIIPFIESVTNKISTKEEIIDIARQPVITRDNVTVHVNGIVFVVAGDVVKATYNVVNYKQAVSNLTMTTIRSQIGAMELDKILSSRGEINTGVLEALDLASSNWGVKVTRVEISDIAVPESIEKSMSLQMKAEREKRAIELEALAKKEAQIRHAEAYKAEQVLKAEAIERMADAEAYTQTKTAEAQKNAIEMINESLAKNQLAGEFLLAKERIGAFTELAKNPNSSKVIIPYETTQVLGSLSLITDFLKNK